MPMVPGSRLGSCEIIVPLGAGGMQPFPALDSKCQVSTRGSTFHVAAGGQRCLFAVNPVDMLSLEYQVALDWAPGPR